MPVRKPGLSNGELFKPLGDGVPLTGAKSVPNLFEAEQSQSLVDAAAQQLLAAHASSHMLPLPPPPPASVIPAPPTGSIYASPSYPSCSRQQLPPGVRSSLSSDTLSNHEENNSGSERPFDELEIDYELGRDESALAAYIEPAVDYEQPAKLSTFNNSKAQQPQPQPHSQPHSQPHPQPQPLIMMMSRCPTTLATPSPSSLAPGSTTPSPLTPRQIKQRNIAKRGSNPCRSSSSTPTLNDSLTSLNNSTSTSNDSTSSSSQFSAQQLSDLQFLQSQKFDAEFIGTTRDLFARYPHAKISISVTVSSTQTNSQSRQQTSTQTTRQIEIDKPMFDRIASLQLQPPPSPPPPPASNNNNNNTSPTSSKVQPQTPMRTSSALTTSSTPTAATAATTPSLSSLSNSLSSSSSSSPSSCASASSYSSSNYDSAISMEPARNNDSPKTEDLHEAIKRVAHEKLKRQQQLQQQQQDSQDNKAQQTSFKAAAVHKLNAATSNNINIQKSTSQKASSSPLSGKSELECAIENRFKRTQQLHSSLCQQQAPTAAQSVPVAPPLPPAPSSNLKAAAVSSLPPPPSPQDLHRLNSTEGQQRPKCPPPPPPIAPLLDGTASLSYKSSQASIQQRQAIEAAAHSLKATTPVTASSTASASASSSAVDPRTSSDFGALIARKAAEKRAKFSETKPSSVNTVTFQPGGSKLDSNSQNANIAKIQVQDLSQSKPKVLVPKPGNSNVTSIVKRMAAAHNVSSDSPSSAPSEPKSVVTINSGVKDKVSIFSQQTAQQLQQLQQQQQHAQHVTPMPPAADGK